jgi:hypothetical protein
MTTSIARTGPTPRAFDTILYGGLIAGTLDAIDGVVALGLKGMNPIQVLQYIASGLFGRGFVQWRPCDGQALARCFTISSRLSSRWSITHSAVSCLHYTNRPSRGDWPTVRLYTFS